MPSTPASPRPSCCRSSSRIWSAPAATCPIIFHSAKTGRTEVLCGQGPAPRAATIEHYRSEGLRLIPGNGLLATVIPGAFDAWMLLLRDHGTLSAPRRAGAGDRLRRARPSAAARVCRYHRRPAALLPGRMADLGRAVPAGRIGAGATAIVPQLPAGGDLAAHPERGRGCRQRPRAGRSRRRATRSTAASSPRRSTASSARPR